MLQEEADAGQALPPAICMHSFAGSLETAQRIIQLVEAVCTPHLTLGSSQPLVQGKHAIAPRVFFGFNAWTNLYKKGIARLVQGISAQRLLLESDWNPEDFIFPGVAHDLC